MTIFFLVPVAAAVACVDAPRHERLWEGPRNGVGWLVNVALWSTETSPGRAVKGAVERVAAQLAATSGMVPAGVMVAVDSRDKKKLSLRRHEDLGDVASLFDPRIRVAVDVIDGESCYGLELRRRVLNSSETRLLLFKNTIAYMWGIARLAQVVEVIVHVDEDVELLPALGYPGSELRVVTIEGALVQVDRARVDWVREAAVLLADDASLLSVHPLPLGPSPLGAHESAMHDAATNCSARDGACACDRPSRPAAAGNGFIGPRHLRIGRCAQIVGGYRPRAPHFSFQSFVLGATRFMDLWPLPGPAHRDVETLIEDAAANAHLLPIFLPPSVLGLVKHEVRRISEARRKFFG